MRQVVECFRHLRSYARQASERVLEPFALLRPEREKRHWAESYWFHCCTAAESKPCLKNETISINETELGQCIKAADRLMQDDNNEKSLRCELA